jgi:hypothetical protein
MSTGLLLAKSENQKERSVARIISIQFISDKQIKEKAKASIREDLGLFYTKPIFRAKKFELF